MKSKLFLKITSGLFVFISVARGDTFFVTNLGVNSITKYDASGGNGTPFTSASINGPNGVVLDSAGNLYVSTNANTIEKFAPDGTDLGVFAQTGVNEALGLTFDRSGNLYAANFGGNTVEKFAPDGTDLGVFAVVIRPTGLAFDAAGNLCVANFGNTIARFSPNGTALASFTSLTLNNPEGLAFDSSGNLYAANNGSNTIQYFSPSGVDLGLLVTSGLSAPIGLAFDTAGNLYVVNSGNATIGRLVANGGGESTFASTGFSPAFLAVQKTPILINISTRLNILTGDNILDAGFIVVGSGSKTVLIRGLGPSLTAIGITGALADPIIELHTGSTNAIIAENDNWKNNQQAAIEATGIPPANDAESALIATLTAGAYTVIERGKLNTTGVGLIEVYDLGAGSGPELGNISTRGFVNTGDDVMIAGFIVASASGGSGQVIVRALGPSLASFGVANPLADPTLELHDGNGTLLAANDNWKTDQE
ncbi:MAG TPA: NHL repeat-containing protein, partial [Chthoniobacterales bacterium]|nr:NHL repeat-containing protein [Chthoniobacterales bacterium]